MNSTTNHQDRYDLVLKGGRIIDPAQNFDMIADLAIRNNAIASIAPEIPKHKADKIVSVSDRIVCPGLIDLHAHIYEWVVSDSLNADDAGIHAGVTTIVDQGDCGSSSFLGFKAYIVENSITDVRCFPCINILGTASPDSDKLALYSPDMVDVDALVYLAEQNPEIIRGIKAHGESGTMSRWGTEVIQLAREAADRANLPLYFHTGVLFDVDDSNRPEAAQVIDKIIPFVKPGDMFTHCYGARPDGLLGERQQVPQSLIDAVREGLLLDLGHGIHFSFDIARRMLEQGLRPYTISSDVHGDFTALHSDASLNFSLCGVMSKLMALGFTLQEVISGTTLHPARILRSEKEIGTLAIGSRADITILDIVSEAWPFYDSFGEEIFGKERLVPSLVIRDGHLIKPHGRLLRDLKVNDGQNKKIPVTA
ncbi:amidohydrolase family protein [Synechococcus sp. PCC 7336]|uniref:amidohydrolase family protein n=1 Tax=Synechococcus sp. PCC 7336 TaxID=195250 RepID=UPI0003463FFC|nr:amidohydrolase family protein [Synechococcus sp. PCC 7336]